jgi:hypothetical protein
VSPQACLLRRVSSGVSPQACLLRRVSSGVSPQAFSSGVSPQVCLLRRVSSGVSPQACLLRRSPQACLLRRVSSGVSRWVDQRVSSGVYSGRIGRASGVSPGRPRRRRISRRRRCRMDRPRYIGRPDAASAGRASSAALSPEAAWTGSGALPARPARARPVQPMRVRPGPAALPAGAGPTIGHSRGVGRAAGSHAGWAGRGRVPQARAGPVRAPPACRVAVPGAVWSAAAPGAAAGRDPEMKVSSVTPRLAYCLP